MLAPLSPKRVKGPDTEGGEKGFEYSNSDQRVLKSERNSEWQENIIPLQGSGMFVG